MSISVLDVATCKSILFEVLDGIPPSETESKEASLFRKEIECSDLKLRSSAQELGLENPLIEFSSSGEV
tara:strand:- start:221 stop:427 length:207 start_codon:yes stop_codon:yes gene_type:complete